MQRKAPAPPKKRLSRDERRRRLIGAAVELFSERGFGGVATKQIADAAGVNEALLFRDFGTKRGLYTAILDAKTEQSRAAEWRADLRSLAERKDDEGLFRFLFGKILDGYRNDPQYQRLLLYAALEGHEISKLFNETRGLPMFTFLTRYVEQRQHDGAFVEGDPRAIAFALFGLPVYYAMVRRLFGHEFLGLSDAEAIDMFTPLVLNGLMKRKAKASKAAAVPRNKRKS
jgi:AcrR family transcriptional regulator